MMPEFSVVICAYTQDRWDDLIAAIAAVQRQTLPAHEVIVVIDHNTELHARACAELPSVTVVANHEPAGLGGARNSGLTAAKGSHIVFLDDDAIAASDWLESLAAGYTDPAVVGIGGAILPTWKSGRPAWFPEEFDWVVGCSYRGLPERAMAVRNLFGCNMSFRREAFATVGPFRLGYGCDETEFCIRVRQQMPDKILLYEPRAKVYHTVPAARGTWHHFATRCFFEGGSKAVVSRLRGRRDGLSNERAYTLKTLPQGVARGVSDTVRGYDLAGLRRAGAILAGLSITTAGYVAGSIRVAEAARRRGWVGHLPERATS